MNPVLEKLLIIQDRDMRIARLTNEKSRIPEEQAKLDFQLQAAKDAVEQAKAEGKRIEVDRKKLEIEASQKMTLVQKYKSQLLEIKNNDQFHALQHQISGEEAEIRKIEDVELDLMGKFESNQLTMKDADAKLRELEQQLDLQRQELNNRAALVEKEMAHVKEERARFAQDVDESILSRYERIFRSKHNQAIVRISNGLCTGCHLKLTAQEVHDAQSGANMVTCTNCGRILYWMPE